MFFTLLSKEVKQHLMTFRFGAALLTTFLLVVVSVWILSEDYIRRRNTYIQTAEESASREREEVFVPSQISPTLHRPPSPLSIFSQGEDKRLGNSVQIRRWVVPREATGSFTDNRMMAVLPAFDFQTLFAVVISLFGLLIAYDGISAERESGTLKLICTGRLRRGTVFTAKFLGCVICLFIPILLSFICSDLLLTFMFQIGFSQSQWAAIGMMFLAGTIYGSIFIALGLLCSALVRRSSTALVLALLFWALAVLIVPGVAQNTAGALVTLPESEEITKLEREMRTEYIGELQDFRGTHPGTGSGSTGGWGSESYYMFDGPRQNFLYTEEYVRYSEPRALSRAERVWQAYKNHEETMGKQAELAGLLAVVSPSQHLRKAFDTLAATDVGVYERFLGACRRYRREMLGAFRQKDYFGSNVLSFFSRRIDEEITDEKFAQRFAEMMKMYEKHGSAFFDNYLDYYWGPLPAEETPPFSFAAAEPDFASAQLPVGILAFTAILLFAAGYVAFIRYDVR
jgi:hypothetical protein